MLAIAYRFPLLLSALVSIKNRSLIRIRRDSDNDYIVKRGNVVYVSGRPTAKLCGEDLKLFTYSYMPRPGDSVIIAGIEDGVELPYFCGLVRPGRVVAIECSSACLRRLEKLKYENDLTNLTIVPGAVSDKNGVGVFVEGDSELSNRVDHVSSKEVDPSLTTVRTMRLTDIAIREGLKTIDYLKLNVEGSEWRALKGLDLSCVRVNNICVSCHDFMDPSLRTYSEVLQWLNENGYKVRRKEYSATRWWDNYYVFGSKP